MPPPQHPARTAWCRPMASTSTWRRPATDPPVILLHGFPELSYSWRHQLGPLAAAGYHAVAPDIRGYGRTSATVAVEAYRMHELVADVLGVLEALGEPTASLVGHDWGAQIAWACAQLHSERFPAIVALSVPYHDRPAVPMTEQAPSLGGRPAQLAALLPGAWPCRRRAGRRPPPVPPTDSVRAVRRRPGRPRHPAAHRASRGHPAARRDPGASAAPALAGRGGPRPLRRAVPPHRLHRRPEPLPQRRPGLARAARARSDHSPPTRALRQRRAGHRHPAGHTQRHELSSGAEPSGNRRPARMRPLGPTGTSRPGE